MKTKITKIDLTPTWSGLAPAIAQLASEGHSDMKKELAEMARHADRAVPLYRALSVIVHDPKIRAWLEANDPKALAQAEEALKP